MKKLSLLFVFVLCGVLFVGCDALNHKDGTQEYSWGVVFAMNYEFAEGKTPSGAQIASVRTALQLEEDDAYWDEKKNLSLYFRYNNYEDFATSFNFDKANHEMVDVTYKDDLFYWERTIKFENPAHVVMTAGKSSLDYIENKVEIALGYTLLGAKVEYYYIFESDYRRTDVPNISDKKTNYQIYDYVFQYDPDNTENNVNEIVVFDRRANTWIWYLLAVVIAVVVGGVVYLLAKCEKKEYSAECPSQSSPI